MEASLYKPGDWNNESTYATYKIIHTTTFGALNISLLFLETPRPEEMAPAANDIISFDGQDYDRYPRIVVNGGAAHMSSAVVAQFMTDTNLAAKILEASSTGRHDDAWGADQKGPYDVGVMSCHGHSRTWDVV